MENQLMFGQDNQNRIHAVESSFGRSGKPLLEPGRVLIGEGRLMKMSRRGPQPKAFFLFNDVLVYGSIILNGRWHKKQKIIPLEDSQIEDLEDGVTMRNQWLIRTPCKSFYVAASSSEEKRAWIEHIEDCRSSLLRSGSCRPGAHFANTWIPDRASAVCMRCSGRFTVTQRRHHCRKCGFVVCGACSKKRAVIQHIHPTKWLRVCTMCHSSLSAPEAPPEGPRGPQRGSVEKIGSDEDDVDGLSEEEEAEEQMEDHDPSKWSNFQMDTWSTYVYFKPEHTGPRVDTD
ncbi:pleckstrin homology domain-containing family F member 1 [Clinocottus analis]|uniref:pleckstrin homology domain-containing family F member 1 n=1 Tax=Clinocottus analis TaxID=304258 RepID=UPI0035BEE73B